MSFNAGEICVNMWVDREPAGMWETPCLDLSGLDKPHAIRLKSNSSAEVMQSLLPVPKQTDRFRPKLVGSAAV